ncbi:unnamed protein product [Zymoseptoria tritici ST99CH_3D7]|uniref:Uncharacterized protein n=1 Tax=Zymoseptoria tritici (strain ST99CH_3D7) TaxID=1276538 RepID=A0A1X7RUF3_ZYMT9|nr:unnamed protein product [Zymoseptoria tritici ST99CH_3D7]
MQTSHIAFTLSMAMVAIADGPPTLYDCSPDAGTGACVVNGQSFACTNSKHNPNGGKCSYYLIARYYE